MSTNKKSFLIFKFKDRGVESDVEQEIEKEDVWLGNPPNIHRQRQMGVE